MHKACNIKNQQAKSSFLKNINKIDGVLARHIKLRVEKTQIINIRNEIEDITIYTATEKRREYTKQFMPLNLMI